MLLICDCCLHNQSEVFKIPSSAFYFEEKSLFVLKEYINMCCHCLLQQEETQQGE
jgi:hypothetical protein